ncbi:MAG: zinc-dependent peptidase, partial [Bacteroidota bacterium]
ILIYPDDYYSTINKVYHQGEVNPLNRIIVISWSNFVRGIENIDGINLGLHEMAHALRLENVIMNEEYDFLDEQLLEKWSQLAYAEMVTIRSGVPTIFREYGATSEQEFFAVAVENFFERPKQFLTYNEDLFWVLARLLNQHHLVSDRL